MPEILSTTQRFHGRIVQVRTDQVRLDDGAVVEQEIVEHAPSITVVPMLDEETVLLIRQYRHPTGEVLLETPAGSLDPGETPEQAAQRELMEEIGYRARSITPLGRFYLAPGWATEFMHAFLACDLEPATAPADKDERIELVAMPLQAVWRLLEAGELRDCKTIAALALARAALGRRSAR
jgi:8-oxo-dGTP pyrophosphatase MutT (NUDIX family)